jgi:hypothetical protein
VLHGKRQLTPQAVEHHGASPLNRATTDQSAHHTERTTAAMTMQLKPTEPVNRTSRRPWLERHLKWLYWACATGLAPWIIFL